MAGGGTRGGVRPAEVAVAAAALLASPAAAQICNSEDPESGGLWFPALGSGGAHVCIVNESDPLGLTYVNALNRSLPCTKAASDPQWMCIVYSAHHPAPRLAQLVLGAAPCRE